MLKTDWSKGAFIAVIISLILGVWGYFAVQAERQIEQELAEVGVTTLATVIECPRTRGSCSANLQYDVPVQDEQNDNRVVTKTYVTNFFMSCDSCDRNWGQQMTIRYLPRDPTQIRPLSYEAYSSVLAFLFTLTIAVLWLGGGIAFIQQKRKKKARATSERQAEGVRLGNLGAEAYHQGQWDQATAYSHQALTIAREAGDRMHEGWWLGNLGCVANSQGQVEQAFELFQQALAIAREVGDPPREGLWLGNLGLVYQTLGQAEPARRYLTQAVARLEEVGSSQADTFRRRLAELEAGE